MLGSKLSWIDKNGIVSTVEGNIGELKSPFGLAFDNDENMYISDANKNTVVKIPSIPITEP